MWLTAPPVPARSIREDSSPWHRVNSNTAVTLDEWPLPPGRQWLDYVNGVETEAELKALRRSVLCGTPYGDTVWQQQTAKELRLESGRPRKQLA